jgi:hypothetical protein
VGALEYHSDAPLTGVAHPTLGLNRQTVSLRVVANAAAAGVFPLIVESAARDAVHFWIGTVWRQQ